MLLKSDDTTISLYVVDENLSIGVVEIGGLDLSGMVNFKIGLQEGKLTLSVTGNGITETGIDLYAMEINAMVIGGAGCLWNDKYCPFGKSSIFYNSFVGHFGRVLVDGVRLTFADISRGSSGESFSIKTKVDLKF